MEPYFTRVSCQVKPSGSPPIPEKKIGYFESTWDVRTNAFLSANKNKIITALRTFPSKYCYYEDFYIVHSPAVPEFGSDEEKSREVDQIAEEQRNSSNMEQGIIYCPIFHDKGSRETIIQRVIVINLEDNKPQAILAAIRYLARLADQFNDEITLGSGYLPLKYYRPWQVDLKVECEDLYDTAWDWLEGTSEMYFVQTILEYDEKSHRLWFVDNKGNKDKEFLNHDLMAQAFYLLVWNHPEGVPDYDLCVRPNDKAGLIREQELKAELAAYYRILNPLQDKHNNDPEWYEKKVNEFCDFEQRKKRYTARSRIQSAFREHETKRVNSDFGEKVAEYYSFDAATGIIKVANRSTTIILPDSLMSERLKKYNAEQADNADKQS